MRFLARMILRRLVERRAGVSCMPGSSQNLILEDQTGRSFAMIARGDCFECYHGKGTYKSFMLSDDEAVKIAKFILFQWYIKGTWFKIKIILWNWARNKIHG